MAKHRDHVVMRLIEDEMKQSFLDYSMSVIVQRALPDVRDGLKPVHRRILYSMHESGLVPNRPFKKSATVVGDVLGKYHPHGDLAVYDALVRMVQDFSLRYPLIAGQGNFGSIDGDSAAAYRYTEAKLTPLAMELLADIDKDTVDFAPNFDDRLKEPVVLPSRVPNLLINGSSGIAVGMSTNIPPHNVGEVVNAALHLLDNPDCEVADLMEFVPGPDFPTGGLIVGKEGIRQAYETGRGRIIMQGRIGKEVRRGGREQLVVTEIPYATSKSRIIEQIADLAKKGKTPDISDLRDESDRDGIRLVIELKRGADARKVVRSLLKWTSLQATFGVIALALDNGAPHEFSLKELLERFRDHRVDVIVRRSRWEHAKAIEEAHLLEGLLIALDNIDRVVAIIRSSRQREIAAAALREEFSLTESQATAILMMRLHRLTELETREVREDLEKLRLRIRELEELLNDPDLQVAEVRRELLEIAERYGDPRRTRIVDGKAESMIESMVAQEDMVVIVSHEGYAKQVPMYLYRRRVAAGKSLLDPERSGNDYAEHVLAASSNDSLLVLSRGGQAYSITVSDIPEGEWNSRGRPLSQVLGLEKEDDVRAILPRRQMKEAVLVFVTAQGLIKRTRIDQFSGQRSGGINAINLRTGDELLAVHASDGTADVVLVTQQGRALRFPETEVSEMGRTAQGVRGIKLEDGDRIAGSFIVRHTATFCAVSTRALALRITSSDLPVRRRDGRGVQAFRVDEKVGIIAGCLEVGDGEALMLVSPGGATARLNSDDVPLGQPGDALVKVVSMPGGARVAQVTRTAGLPREESTSPDGGESLPTEVAAVGAVQEAEGDPAQAPEEPGDGDRTARDQFDLLG